MQVGDDVEVASMEICEPRRDNVETDASQLWDVLMWIDTFDPETTAAAEARFGFDLLSRTFKRQSSDEIP